MSPEEALADINQQIKDMNTAKMAAIEKGKKIGDYDLAAASMAVSKDRELAEAQQLSLTTNINPIQEQLIQKDPNIPLEEQTS